MLGEEFKIGEQVHLLIRGTDGSPSARSDGSAAGMSRRRWPPPFGLRSNRRDRLAARRGLPRATEPGSGRQRDKQGQQDQRHCPGHGE